MPQREDVVIEDKRLEALLDSVDERTAIQQVLHNHISDGFMSLARERYRDPSTFESMLEFTPPSHLSSSSPVELTISEKKIIPSIGLGQLVYDEREDVTSEIHLLVKEDRNHNGVVRMERIVDSVEEHNRKSSATLRRRKGAEKQDNGNGGDPSHRRWQTDRTNVKNTFVAMPSAELRSAICTFRLAVDEAIDLVNRNNQLGMALSETDIPAK